MTKKTAEEPIVEEKEESVEESSQDSGETEAKDANTDENLTSEEQRIQDLEAQIETLKLSEKEAKDEALRSLAEMENFRKRNQQEVTSFKKYAAESTVSELLPVLDNFILACNHLEQLDDAVKKEFEGVLLIRKQFLDALQKVNVAPIEALDQPFDPNFHQAISQEEVEGKDAGIVVKEVQRGFLLHDRVIRPSLVVVSV